MLTLLNTQVEKLVSIIFLGEEIEESDWDGEVEQINLKLMRLLWLVLVCIQYRYSPKHLLGS